MIDPTFDPANWRAILQREGRVQVRGFLQPEVAQQLRHCLQHDVPWTLALRDADGPRTIANDRYRTMSDADVAHLLAGVAAGSRDDRSDEGFRFVYDSYMMVTAYQQKRDPGLLLHRVLEVLNSPGYLDAMRALTGDAVIRRVNAQATRYRPGHFLNFHTDADSDEGRRFAYVLNLSREWREDWGGQLQFVDEDGRITDQFLPRWNSLSLFKVPAGHAVSMVTRDASDDRLAITGWLLS